MSPLNLNHNDYVAALERSMVALGGAPQEVQDAAIGKSYQVYLQQASVLAYSNTFLYISVLAFLMAPLCLLISKKSAGEKPSGHRTIAKLH